MKRGFFTWLRGGRVPGELHKLVLAGATRAPATKPRTRWRLLRALSWLAGFSPWPRGRVVWRICGWCNCMLGVALWPRTARELEPLTHGMCERCQARWSAEASR